jgi:hypothetical protein
LIDGEASSSENKEMIKVSTSFQPDTMAYSVLIEPCDFHYFLEIIARLLNFLFIAGEMYLMFPLIGSNAAYGTRCATSPMQ